jgi:hypothetical protein
MTIPGVVTDLGREKWAKTVGGINPLRITKGFKVGEGGWIDPGTGRVPRTPDPTLLDLDVKVHPAWYPPPHDSYYPAAAPPPDYGKAFIATDVSFVAPLTLRLRCRLDATEYLDDGHGFPPEIWELGVFDEDGDMVAYFTFPMQVKVNLVLENYVNITF